MSESRFKPMTPVTGRRKTEDETGDPMHDYEEIDEVHREVAAVAAETGTYHQQHEWPAVPATETATMPGGELPSSSDFVVDGIVVPRRRALRILAELYGWSGAQIMTPDEGIKKYFQLIADGRKVDAMAAWGERLSA